MKLKLGRYKHYKGHFYEVLGIGKHSETLEELVFYKALYKNPDGIFWVRPLKMFKEKVLVDGKNVARFKFIKK